MVSLRDKQYLQDQLDVFNILRDFDTLMNGFDIRSLAWSDALARPGMQEELETTAMNFDVGTTFWHLSLTDIPWQLGEGTRTYVFAELLLPFLGCTLSIHSKDKSCSLLGTPRAGMLTLHCIAVVF